MARLQQGTKAINERSYSQITVTFLDPDKAVTTPTSARYRIDDITRGCETQVLDWTAISTPSSSETITITAEQNRILYDSNDTEKRIVTIEATGSNSEPFRECFVYEINNLPGTP